MQSKVVKFDTQTEAMIKKKKKFTYYKNKAAEKGIELVDSKQKRKYADELTRTI